MGLKYFANAKLFKFIAIYEGETRYSFHLISYYVLCRDEISAVHFASDPSSQLLRVRGPMSYDALVAVLSDSF